jgi:hypothetical protein
MLSLTVLLFWLVTDESFRVTEASVTVSGIEYADEAAVRAQLSGIARAPNVFRVRASDLVKDMRALHEVSSASASVTLPARVSVQIDERQPLFTWSDGNQDWLVDENGVLFARVGAGSDAEVEARVDDEAGVDDETDTASQTEAETEAEAMGPLVPRVEDERISGEPLEIGARLPAIDLAVMRQLLTLTPESLGTEAADLILRVDQIDGYVLRLDLSWQAVFGHYSPILQPPEDIARQVQCLRWLLASREPRLERIRLSISENNCGTFTRYGKQS